MKNAVHSILTIVVVCSFFLFAQDCFATQWENTYGGSADERADYIQKTSDGGFIMAGYTESYGAGNQDIWIIKLESDGTISWEKTYGGGSNELANSIQQTSDGGYIVAGWTNSFGIYQLEFWVLKLDAEGNVIWQKTYGGAGDDRSQSIQQTSDGGYIVAGLTWSFGAGMTDILILRLNANGTVLWQKTYGGSNVDVAYSIQQTIDGNYIVAGCFDATAMGDFYHGDMIVLKLDPWGNVIWQKTYGGAVGERAYSIQQTADGGYVVAGESTSFGDGSRDVWVLKLDGNGNVTWQKNFGGNLPNSDYAYSVRQTIDGGAIVAGYTGSFGTGVDSWVLKLCPDGTDCNGNLEDDNNGEIDWQKLYGANGSEWAYAVQRTRDGGYVMAGKTVSFGAGLGDVWVLKLDSNGEINNCDFIHESTATVVDSAITGVSGTSVVSSPVLASDDSTAIPQDSTAQVGEHCFAPDWFPVDPPPQNKLNGVWGYLSSDSPPKQIFYAVGEEGIIIQYDGNTLVGSANYTLNDLYGIWGNEENGIVTNIFTVGDNSTIVRYVDQTGWENVTHSLPTVNLKDVWGSSASDVYAVGEGGFIAYYNGSSWSEIPHGLTSATLTSIWGSAANNYVAVGEGGTIIEYDGSWSTASSPTSEDLSEVWGSSSDNIYAVGTSGTIIHYDGLEWSEIESPTSANLRGIWGSSENNIFAVGEHGTILYYDGTSWIKMDSGVQDSLISTFGTLNPRVMVVGYDGNILSLGGPSVQGKICNACSGEAIDEVTVEFDKHQTGETGVEYQIAQTDTDGIYPTIPSQGGPYPLLFTATDYLIKEITVDLPFNSSIVDHATYLLPDPGYQDCLSGTITRTVNIGTIPKENDRGVQNMEVVLYQNDTPIGSTVTDVGGNYYFTGLTEGGNYRIEPVITASECYTTPETHTSITVPTTDQYTFALTCPEPPQITQGYWQEMTSGTENLLHSIWGSASTNIYAVGDNGEIIHYSGTSWTSQTSTTTENLKGVWGSSGTDIYAVGAEGTVLKTEDGGATPWSAMTSNTPNGLNAIWGNSDTDIFAVGDKGTIIHYDGDGDNNGSPDDIWELMNSQTQVKLLGVWGTSGSDVYAVGNSHKDEYWKRTVIHYDGNPQLEWTEVPTGNGVTLMSPWGSATDDITAAGSFGSIMRYKEWEVGQGAEWRQIGGPTEKTLNAMWGSSGNHIFAVGYKGVIAHYDGTEWSVRETEQGTDLYGIWGETSPDIYAVAVGDRGKIYEYKGDIDNDGEADATDNCLNDSNPGQDDFDEDGLGDVCDNCLNDANEGQENSDYDTLGNACDNCPFDTNEGQENGDGDSYGDVCDNCPADTNEDQTDSYPPPGNNCGDACECEGNFDGDLDVDGGDAGAFKADFGRSSFKNPCTNEIPCNGDFTCDNDVDGADAATFKEDFGRSGFKNPCPSCVTEPWCVY